MLGALKVIVLASVFSTTNPSAPANVISSCTPSLPVSLKIALEPAPDSEEIPYVVSVTSLVSVISLLALMIDNPVPAVRIMSLVIPCESDNLTIFFYH